VTHRHAFKRGVAPRPSDKDVRVWRRLLKRAAPVGQDPMTDALSFAVAADKAAKAIAPVGYQDRASPFVALVRIGQGFLKLNAVERIEQGERVKGLVEECRTILDRQDGGPQLRLRLDIDG